jgi:hypothetical protein
VVPRSGRKTMPKFSNVRNEASQSALIVRSNLVVRALDFIWSLARIRRSMLLRSSTPICSSPPRRGSDKSALGNAQGTTCDKQLSPERAKQAAAVHPNHQFPPKRIHAKMCRSPCWRTTPFAEPQGRATHLVRSFRNKQQKNRPHRWPPETRQSKGVAGCYGPRSVVSVR